jgi:hypothetical protein
VWWQRWDGPDINQHHPPRPRRVRRGAGPAGLPAPKHPATPECVTIYTDGGCVEAAYTTRASTSAPNSVEQDAPY